jgi:hypothetical protein
MTVVRQLTGACVDRQCAGAGYDTHMLKIRPVPLPQDPSLTLSKVFPTSIRL